MAVEQFFYETIEQQKEVDEYFSFLVTNSQSLAVIGLLFTVGKGHTRWFLKELQPFLGEFSFYEWDFHSRSHSHIQERDVSQVWQELVKKWNQRLHRSFDLRSVVVTLLLNNQTFRSDFEPIRKKWQQILGDQRQQGDQNILLTQVVPQLDVSNYERKESDEGTYFEYKEPADVQAEMEEGRKASLETLMISQLADKCQMMIDNDLPFDLAGAQYLWSRIQADAGALGPELEKHCTGEWAFASPYTNIFAAFKVLLHHKATWILQHPEYREWIRSFSSDVIERQFAYEGSFEQHGTDRDWNILLAEVASSLYFENPKDKSVRKIVAGCLLLFNPATVKALLTAAAQRSKWNTPVFVQIQNLLLYYSRDNYRRGEGDAQSDKPNVRAQLATLFVEEQIPLEPVDWATLRGPEEWKLKEVEHWQESKKDRVRRAGLNTWMLATLMQCLPSLSEIREEEERSYVRNLLTAGLNQVIYQLGEIKDDSFAIKSLETDFEKAVLRNVAKSILYVENNVKKDWWEPLFRFGYIAQSRIREFCNTYFVNLDKPQKTDEMVALLQEMVEYTHTAPTWATRYANRFEDFRICLLGFHSWRQDMCKHDYSTFTQKAESIYKKWFAKRQMNPFATDALLDFIVTPSGRFMLKNGLYHLAVFFNYSLRVSQQEAPKGRVWTGHPELDNKLASTLSALWEFQREQLTADRQVYALYRELLQYLLAMRNAVGIELQNSLLMD